MGKRFGCVFVWKMEKDARHPALLLIAVSPILWYAVLANHTNIRHLFTYRIFNVGILAALGAVAVSLEWERNEKTLQKTTQSIPWIRSILEWGAIAIVAVMLLPLYGEEVYVINSSGSFLEVPMPEGTIVGSEFIPEYAHVTEMRIGIRTESAEGR